MFELDSGAQASTITRSDALSADGNIVPTPRRVHAYNGSPISLLGECTLNVFLNGVATKHSFLVVENVNTNLFGRDLFKKFNVSITFPDTVNCNSTSVLEVFNDYLSPDFQSCVKDTINLKVDPNHTPVFCKARPIPVKLRDKVKTELQRLVDSGKLTRVYSSDYASPIVVCFKKDGSLRICGDYSVSINKFLDPVQTPLPTINEVLSQVGHATIYSQIDLSQAFMQLRLGDDSKKYTTINTSEGLFRYEFLPFGLRASSGIFQAFITKVLNGIDDIIVYQDDILVLSPNLQSHNRTLNIVLTALKNAGVKINPVKCKFYTNEVKYLGYIFTNGDVHTDPDKIRAIMDAPAPTDLKQLQAFIGMCNYYSRFISDFASIMSPMYALLKKDVKFVWNSEQQRSFEHIKHLFRSNNILKLFNPHHEILLETDSSGYGVAAVLFQRTDPSAPWLPVQCASRTLNAAERNYSNIEREALSVVYGTEKFKHCLLGSVFTIHNDQKALANLFAHDSGVPSSCSSRIQRWSLKLSQYNYVFSYSKGKDNVTSDCLSRLPLPETVIECEPYELVCTLDALDENTQTTITCDDIKTQTDLDPDLRELKLFIKNGCPDRISNPNLSKMKSMIPQMTILKGCIMYCNRVLVPKSLRRTVLQQFHEGHPGISGMKSLVRSLIWYPGLDKDVEDLVNSCMICQTVRAKPPQNKNIEWPVPPRSWSRIHVDHFFYDNKICFLAVDAFTKYIECEIVASTSVSETIDALRLIFSRNGLCDLLVSDNASCFTADEFQSFLSNNGIQHITPPPYSPASNGQAERGVKVLKDMLKKCDPKESLKTRLAKVLFQYRCVPHSVTQMAPCVSLNGRKFVTKRDRINPSYAHTYDPKPQLRKIPQYEVGDNVMALNVREGPKWLRATIVQVIGINVYLVHVHDSDVLWKRHANQILLLSHVPPIPPEPPDTPTIVVDEPNIRRSDRMRKPVRRDDFVI